MNPQVRSPQPSREPRFPVKAGEPVIRCMECNYDLAGVPHNNDVRTCPECGYPNPLAGPPDPPAPKVAKSVAQSLCPTTLLFLLAMVADALQPKRHGTLNHFF